LSTIPPVTAAGGEARRTIGVWVLDAPLSGGEHDAVPPGFTRNLHHKDLGIVMSVAREADAVIPVGSVVTQLMGALVAQGHGGPDSCALLRLVEQSSGRDQPARSGSHG
jgi:2-hydroxy-3-oxopropionate reductase